MLKTEVLRRLFIPAAALIAFGFGYQQLQLHKLREELRSAEFRAGAAEELATQANRWISNETEKRSGVPDFGRPVEIDV